MPDDVKPVDPIIGPPPTEAQKPPFVEPPVEVKPVVPQQARAMTPRDKVAYDKLLKELDECQNGRALGDITLKDSYWAKRDELNAFLANVVYI